MLFVAACDVVRKTAVERAVEAAAAGRPSKSARCALRLDYGSLREPALGVTEVGGRSAIVEDVLARIHMFKFLETQGIDYAIRLPAN